jgi:protein-arginine kinase
MTNIATIAFDQKQIKDRKNSLLDVIYHEIAHCFHYADNNWLLIDYKENPSMKQECELRAIRLSRRWRNTIKHNARGTKNDLQSNVLLIRASHWYDVTPLEIGIS